ncbi:hypothetical protein TIFTF001_016524 [Ficus carica]|uniref:Uncharacterized protein n=1 Tax=Ficus carica TaxID=3494 RepID=A0AA88A7U8_FICCA|nr:hypothetical protein TIFTF001_016524 [Ficus carica]
MRTTRALSCPISRPRIKARVCIQTRQSRVEHKASVSPHSTVPDPLWHAYRVRMSSLPHPTRSHHLDRTTGPSS